ncbi:lipase family alpha/beta hydrolase [Nocardioides sp.]|uniref:lipase family alpha/beta hydrolase n=1 Tax=Nocardioides sp. TaxID=35761 RepID=UPI0035123EA9
MTSETTPTVLDALALATAVADDLLVATARDTHDAISRRVHGVVRLGTGPAGRPAEVVHRGIASGVYGALGVGLRGASRGLAKAARSGRGPALESHPAGRFLSSAVNGLIGEELARERPALAIRMAVRVGERDIEPTRPALTRAFPDASGQVVVLLHGLCEHEGHWARGRAERGTTYPEQLAEAGWTPVLLRANTGLGVRPNGVALAALLQRIVDEWPVPVERLAIVGHSMGGLIARTALAVRAELGGRRSWVDLVSDVVTLGTPHLGAPLARTADRGTRALGRLPESRAFGTFIDRRSIGIRDLQLGLAEVPPEISGLRYRLVAGSLTAHPRHPVARTLGDLLVTPDSAFGIDPRGRELFPLADRIHVPRAGHFDLLNHPDVAQPLLRWLAEPSSRPAVDRSRAG